MPKVRGGGVRVREVALLGAGSQDRVEHVALERELLLEREVLTCVVLFPLHQPPDPGVIGRLELAGFDVLPTELLRRREASAAEDQHAVRGDAYRHQQSNVRERPSDALDHDRVGLLPRPVMREDDAIDSDPDDRIHVFERCS